MRFIEEQAVGEANCIAILGAQGARPDHETGIRELSAAGLGRVAMAADIIAANPDAEGTIFNFAGYGMYSGGGPAPVAFAQTEAAAHERELNTRLRQAGVEGHNWTFVPSTDVDEFDLSDFAGSTVQEAVLISAGIARLGQQRRHPKRVHFIGGPKHLERLDEVFNAMEGVPSDTFVGIPNYEENEGLMATVTGWIYRALVIRGASDSLLPEEIVNREQATVGRLFGAAATLKGIASRLKLVMGRSQPLPDTGN